jgi:hypothetical protein
MRKFTYTYDSTRDSKPNLYYYQGSFIQNQANIETTWSRGEPQAIKTSTKGMLINGVTDLKSVCVSDDLVVQAVFPFLEVLHLHSIFGQYISSEASDKRYEVKGDQGRWYWYHITDDNQLHFSTLRRGDYFAHYSEETSQHEKLSEGNSPWIIHQTMTMNLTSTISIEEYSKRLCQDDPSFSADDFQQAINDEANSGQPLGFVMYLDKKHLWQQSGDRRVIVQPQVERETVQAWLDIPENMLLNLMGEDYGKGASIVEVSDDRQPAEILAEIVKALDQDMRQAIILADLIKGNQNQPFTVSNVKSFGKYLQTYTNQLDKKPAVLLPGYLAYRQLDEKRASRWLKYNLQQQLTVGNEPESSWLDNRSPNDVLYIAKALASGDYPWFLACCTHYVEQRKPTLAYVDALQQACPKLLDDNWKQSCKDFMAIKPEELEQALQWLPKEEWVDWVVSQITKQINPSSNADHDKLSNWLNNLAASVSSAEVVRAVYTQWADADRVQSTLRRLSRGIFMKAAFVLMIVLVVHYVFGLGTLAYIALNIMLDIMNVLFAAHLALLPSLVGSPFMAFLVNTFLIVGCFTFFMGLDMPQSSALRQSEQPLGLVEKKFIESQRQSTWALLMNLFDFDVRVANESKAVPSDAMRSSERVEPPASGPKQPQNGVWDCFFGPR